MKFVVSREALLKPLQLVAGVVERRQTLPVLSNVLIVLNGDQLSLTGTDLEVEIIGRVHLEQAGESGEITVPARKLVDICRSLPDGSKIEFLQEDSRIIVKSGRSRFTLSTLPASDFPNVEGSPGNALGIVHVSPCGEVQPSGYVRCLLPACERGWFQPQNGIRAGDKGDLRWALRLFIGQSSAHHARQRGTGAAAVQTVRAEHGLHAQPKRLSGRQG